MDEHEGCQAQILLGLLACKQACSGLPTAQLPIATLRQKFGPSTRGCATPSTVQIEKAKTTKRPSFRGSARGHRPHHLDGPNKCDSSSCRTMCVMAAACFRMRAIQRVRQRGCCAMPRPAMHAVCVQAKASCPCRLQVTAVKRSLCINSPTPSTGPFTQAQRSW